MALPIIPFAIDRSVPIIILRCTATGAAVMAVIFAVCWLAAVANMAPASHMYMLLFSIAPISSVQALTVGVCWSLAFGALAGALVAIFYRVFGFLAR
jgi:hypothetical protein